MTTMAGSYNHCVTDEGQLRDPESLADMLENGGDVYEAVHEMYGMIWLLAGRLAYITREETADLVEEVRRNSQMGVDLSPGVLT